MRKPCFSVQSQTHILSISSVEAKAYAAHYKTPEFRFTHLPPGIASRFMRERRDVQAIANKRAALQLDSNDSVWLFVGSGYKTKGLDRAIEYLAEYRRQSKAVLLIAGQDDATQYLAQAKKLNVDQYIVFLGARDDVDQLIWAADILLHPAYRENTGTILLEALSAGLPVLTTNACGYAHHIVDAGLGELAADPDDAAAVCQQIQRILALEPDENLARSKKYRQTVRLQGPA